MSHTRQQNETKRGAWSVEREAVATSPTADKIVLLPCQSLCGTPQCLEEGEGVGGGWRVEFHVGERRKMRARHHRHKATAWTEKCCKSIGKCSNIKKIVTKNKAKNYFNFSAGI